MHLSDRSSIFTRDDSSSPPTAFIVAFILIPLASFFTFGFVVLFAVRRANQRESRIQDAQRKSYIWPQSRAPVGPYTYAPVSGGGGPQVQGQGQANGHAADAQHADGYEQPLGSGSMGVTQGKGHKQHSEVAITGVGSEAGHVYGIPFVGHNGARAGGDAATPGSGVGAGVQIEQPPPSPPPPSYDRAVNGRDMV